jgi:phospholipase/lecithinase/hemolysin
MSHESRNSTLVVFGDSLSDNGNLFDLIGQPAPPAWEGRASNGPTYAEQLARMLHMRLDDRAFAAAEASDASPPVLIDPATGMPCRSISRTSSPDISRTCTAIRLRTTRPC